MEKNPNAVVTLQNRVVSDGWQGTVTVVPADMREWEAPEQADILVRCGTPSLVGGKPPGCRCRHDMGQQFCSCWAAVGGLGAVGVGAARMT